MKKLLIIALALTMLIGILSAQKPMVNPNANPGPRTDSNPNLKDRPMPEMPMMGMMERLNLSEAQKTKLEDQRTAHMKMMNTAQAEIENIKIDLQTAIKSENFKRAKELNKQLYAKKLSLADARIDHIAAMIKELTAEQKAMIKDHLPMMGMHKGMRGGMMGPNMGKGMQKMHMQHGDCTEMGKGMGMGMERKHMNRGNCDDCEDCTEHKSEQKPMTPPNTDKQLNKSK